MQATCPCCLGKLNVALRASAVTFLATEAGRHLQPACRRGTMLPGSPPPSQPMVLTSPTERWARASAWLPTISLLLGFSSTNYQ